MFFARDDQKRTLSLHMLTKGGTLSLHMTTKEKTRMFAHDDKRGHSQFAHDDHYPIFLRLTNVTLLA